MLSCRCYLLQRQIHGDCVDMAPMAKQRDDVVISFLLILKKARQHHVGPSLRSIVYSLQTDVCKYLGYRYVYTVSQKTSHFIIRCNFNVPASKRATFGT